MQTKDGCIWATGSYGKLLRLNPGTGKQHIFDFGTLFGDKVQTLMSFALQEDGKGQIWIGTQYGLLKGILKNDKMTFSIYKPDVNKPNAINHSYILSLLPDPKYPDKRLWIGTKGGGINCLDLGSEKFSHLTSDQGLPNNVVYGILADDEGNLWCSSNRGLAKLNISTPGQYQITPFTAGDGLQSNEFNTQAFYKAADGELLFGGVNGINHFFPKDLQFKSKAPEVYIIGLKVNYLPLKFSTTDKQAKIPIEFLDKLELDYTRNNLSFEFAAMDFTDPNKNQYRYQLLPIEKKWIRPSNERFAHYTHLAPGSYTFRVQGSNSVGIWNESPVEMTIIISPPWWFSNPAYILYTLFLGIIIWQFWRFQLNRIKLKEQLAFELREAERLKDLEQLKTNFFNNVTHEFRTPLSLILEPARQILSKTEDPEIRKNATHVESNSLRLLNMINQLLDLAKLESKSIGLELRHGNLTELLQNTIHSFTPLAEKLGVSLTLTIKKDIPLFFFDAGKTELIINNLISNALKFTPGSGNVEVIIDHSTPNVNESHSSPHSLVSIKVKDTGTGIPPDELEKIFQRFYQVSGSTNSQLHSELKQPEIMGSSMNGSHKTAINPGTGIGLALSKEFAELMGGGISVESEPGIGSCFNFSLPMREINSATTHPLMKESDHFVSSIESQNELKFSPTENAEFPLALVIEDNPELRQFISQSIQKNWKVEEACDGEEGIQKAIELIPDIIVSDLMMPKKDGYEVCNTLKNHELTSHIPVILLTARANIDSKLAGLRTGADDYLTKPFHTEELLLRMSNLLEMRRKLQARFSNMNPDIFKIDGTNNPTELSPLDNEFLRRFIDILQENIEDENFGVEEFAHKMFISRSQLHRKLKALTDQNATDFIRDFRLEKAMEMLQDQEVQVNEVASRIGYSNVKYFSTIFKAKYGISPSQVNSKN
ncbi:MAG: response regulator [Saprospiraceae bacterium]|nr:response regulator [Saprospiraceae bacterium]